MASVLVDGRVFSTPAFDRGMGRYVSHLIALLGAEGHAVTVLLFQNCKVRPDKVFPDVEICRLAFEPENFEVDDARRGRKLHDFTSALSTLIEEGGYEIYVDATPFIGPLRLDLFGCAVIAVCYDYIPLKHPDFYLSQGVVRKVYYNGLARLLKADHVICIANEVRGETARFLGVPESKLSVICPPLEARYAGPKPRNSGARPYLFSILGHHKSKNPAGALAIFIELLNAKLLDVRVNGPKHDQMKFISDNLVVPPEIHITSSISDEEKFDLQSNASIIAHLSLEEGFGIPLLEALFLDKKVLALDTPINREFFAKAPTGFESCVFLLQPTERKIDVQKFSGFLQAESDPEFFAAIRTAYKLHWKESPAIFTSAIKRAVEDYNCWGSNLQAKIFSSIPGSACGVADYSLAYARSATGNVMLFFSEGEQENISFVPNLRAASYLDFERFGRSRFGGISGLFNFAFSPALNPGIKLLKEASRAGDVLLIHERLYFSGYRSFLEHAGRLAEADLDLGPERGRFSVADNSSVTEALALSGNYRPRWMANLNVRYVSHLSPAVVQEMQLLEKSEPGVVFNDLAWLEGDMEFVPLGIDDRRRPGLVRAASRIRINRKIGPRDVVVGHYGLILNDLKLLWEVITAFIAYASEQASTEKDGRRVFFFLVGKVVDFELFSRIVTSFAEAGLADRLYHSTPAEEEEFDAEIVACDAVVCFRKQIRGQLSHIFVRALALGTPVIVNKRSGYSYDPRTTVNDNDVAGDLARTIDELFDERSLASMRLKARNEYESSHRGDDSLERILGIGIP